ncbi:MAG TPA: DUF305 domain-containing protein [Pyrinomonadaceae bacterium]
METRWKFAIITMIIGGLVIKGQQTMHKHAIKSEDDSAWAELQSSMEKMHLAMHSIAASDNSDADFVRLMIPHHQAAIDMAKTQLLYGKDAQMRRLAQEIIADQQSEIELMSLWLKEHRLDPSGVTLRKPTARKE